jgi:hypothetical protein
MSIPPNPMIASRTSELASAAALRFVPSPDPSAQCTPPAIAAFKTSRRLNRFMVEFPPAWMIGSQWQHQLLIIGAGRCQTQPTDDVKNPFGATRGRICSREPNQPAQSWAE